MYRYLYTVCLLSLIFCKTNAQNASFYKEDITYKIDNNYFYVNGIYYLKCKNVSTNKQIALFYPFPTDTIYSPPDSIHIYNLNNGHEIINYIKKNNGILFSLEIDSITPLLISYRQELKSNEARYILTTTKQWNEPFEEATYKLITTDRLNIKSFSYKPDKQEQIDGNIIYYWKKENFMPLKDMIFTF